jgi:hypothetical protein
MSSYDLLEQRVREIHTTRFKEFELELLRKKELADRAAKIQKPRQAQRREFLKGVGIELKKLDAEIEKEERVQERELKELLGLRSKHNERPSLQALDSKYIAVRGGTYAEAGYKVLSPYASAIYAPSRGDLQNIDGEHGNGAINSGWVFPSDPSKIRVRSPDNHTTDACRGAEATPFQASRFEVHFAFIPATTGTYEMTGILGFHGFYLLRADDGFFSCRSAEVSLTVDMNVHQYVDAGWKTFPKFLDRVEQNVNEISNFDRTGFFDYTTPLRAGDPVVVTLRGHVFSGSWGGYTHAELNFADGNANYVEPLFLSVIQV